MKPILRNRAVQRTLAWMLASYLKFAFATMRWTVEGEAIAARARTDMSVRTIVCFWHSRISMCGAAWRNAQAPKQISGLISHSNDGDFISEAMRQFGFPSVRGSRAPEDSTVDKGGGAAFREIVRALREGRATAITPDGPRGPAQVMGEGAPLIARLGGAEVLLLGMACHPCIRANSWDKAVLPLPFSRGALVWTGPFTVKKTDNPNEIAEAWTGLLNAATDRAEALVA